ncbi:MAG: hypothetical protein CVT67_02980 [Actinobacteria bacterium HGW-Actinobacteria-7]|jgi:cystathionine beta-lyase family protein involved in aluminum resistance|nr:MAG: hypothetical protein CVT67_02980 [Actinobacteria bacterium HGW-Actinobacteria-7]
MDRSQARFLIGILLTLFVIFAGGYFFGIPSLVRGAATSMTGFGIGILGMATLKAIRGRAS